MINYTPIVKVEKWTVFPIIKREILNSGLRYSWGDCLPDCLWNRVLHRAEGPPLSPMWPTMTHNSQEDFKNILNTTNTTKMKPSAPPSRRSTTLTFLMLAPVFLAFFDAFSFSDCLHSQKFLDFICSSFSHHSWWHRCTRWRMTSRAAERSWWPSAGTSPSAMSPSQSAMRLVTNEELIFVTKKPCSGRWRDAAWRESWWRSSPRRPLATRSPGSSVHPVGADSET